MIDTYARLEASWRVCNASLRAWHGKWTWVTGRGWIAKEMAGRVVVDSRIRNFARDVCELVSRDATIEFTEDGGCIVQGIIYLTLKPD